ncbi:MAG: hypothetical protein AAF573_14565, partial [Bacteroidota bacterium]
SLCLYILPRSRPSGTFEISKVLRHPRDHQRCGISVEYNNSFTNRQSPRGTTPAYLPAVSTFVL